MKRGPTSTVMCRESLLWKEVGCRKDCAAWVGQTKRSVVDVTRRRNGAALIVPLPVLEGNQKPDSREFLEMGAKGKDIKVKLEVAKRRHVASIEWKPLGRKPLGRISGTCHRCLECKEVGELVSGQCFIGEWERGSDGVRRIFSRLVSRGVFSARDFYLEDFPDFFKGFFFFS